MALSPIVIKGAREHNLQDVSLELPRNRLICFTGVSGSGKSSLAFDTLYAEGQRRYVESLSSYARQFLGQMPKPDVDLIRGLAPAISIQQKTGGRNPRSTVGTITEIADFLRVLYARVGQGHCPDCGRPIAAQTREQILDRILALAAGTRYLILAPLVRGQKGEYRDLFAELLKKGFVRARVDGQLVNLTENLRLGRQIRHDIEVVTDRLTAGPTVRPRLAEAVEAALRLGQGTLIVAVEGRGEDVAPASTRAADLLLSAHYACGHCQKSYEPPSPQLFSFNSPQGMCPGCDGLGTKYNFDPHLVVPDRSRTVADGAIETLGKLGDMGPWRRHLLEGVAATIEQDRGLAAGSLLRTPWAELPRPIQTALLHGLGDRPIPYTWKAKGDTWRHSGPWPGVIPDLLSKYRKSTNGTFRRHCEKYMRIMGCTACQGARLNPQARAVRVGGKTLVELGAMPIAAVVEFFRGLTLEPMAMRIAEELLKEIRTRLAFLADVGLDYLSLDRTAPTLSGGEAQRIRLAGQVGAGLVGVLYVLDEPSVGLHARDNERLLRTLQRLRDLGNTVVVVEHDEETMRAADHLVDFGPGPGVKGGAVVASGSYDEVVANPQSLTGQYLAGRRRIAVPARRRPPGAKWLTVRAARHNNLQDIDVPIPLGGFVCVTGVSGSGKSSLVGDILQPALSRDLHGAQTTPGLHGAIEGVEHLDKVIDIDQSPIGRTPRSNPATYVKVLDAIRDLYTILPEAKTRGYKPGRFSFNVRGGRCEACEGNGSNRLEMDFLADVWVTCPVCQGRRFNRETLHVRYKGRSIADVLEMDVQEALDHFEHVPKIRAMLQTLHDVGLDYIKLGQPSPTLSGGEAQRIKLAKELCRRSTGRTLYILDEPTTGLHFADIQKLLEVLHGFVDVGNTVLVIEHNLDVIKTADWIIDLGPEGGAGGGRVVASGSPEEVARVPESFTGQALRTVLPGWAGGDRGIGRGRPDPRATPLEDPGTGHPKAPANGALSEITVRGARQHNLKGISVAIPRDRMTVFSGPSGSGKSSLAMDTIYAEGQRRYVESLSSYARQFLAPLQKPRVDSLTGLSPAVSIEQKTTSKSPRSTVGTVTEIYDYLRILFARLGKPYCPDCDRPIGTQSSDEITEKILGLPDGTRLHLMAPVEKRETESYADLWAELRASGYLRIRVDGQSHTLDHPPAIDHRRKHQVDVVIDRVVIGRDHPANPRTGDLDDSAAAGLAPRRSRIADSVEAALDLGQGVLRVAHVDPARDETQWRIDTYSQHFVCAGCGRSFEELTPHHFSFNSPLGWCPVCEGLGVQQGANPAVLVPRPERSLRAGAVAAWPDLDRQPIGAMFEALARHCGFSLDCPFEDLEPRHQRAILHGTGDAWIPLANPNAETSNPRSAMAGLTFQYKGLLPAIDEAGRVSFVYRNRLESLVTEVPCMACGGSRLRSDAAAVRFRDRTIGQVVGLPLGGCERLFRTLELSRAEQHIAGELLREIRNRLKFLVDVGLDYLTLGRATPTLSGGESQRIRLASQIGSGLTGVLYVLDEPTIGLHPRDNRRLLGALQHLRDLGNTLILVEHDREVIEAADHLLDFGPGAGDRGGEVVAAGPPQTLRRLKTSLTGQYLAGARAIPVPAARRPADGPCLEVIGARHNNLKGIDVAFPLGTLIGVTGVSGSGKSSLVGDILSETLAHRLHRARSAAAAHDAIRGVENLDKVITVDQSPIGNSPSSNPATYTGVFDLIRRLFAQTPEAKMRGYQARRFSFNKPGGRCEACEGNGQKKIEMHFLPDVWVECETCKGARYNPETLAVRFKDHTIAEVLDLRVSAALELFGAIPQVSRILGTLRDVGLDYLRLGQAAPTLSGGEAQRVKLAAELARPQTGRTLYLLDEPTTGLHFDDLRKLLDVLDRLVDLGNTVIVIEHNLDVIKTADWVIDLGPEAGDGGGRVVACGTPEQVAFGPPLIEGAVSHTGQVLRHVLETSPRAKRPTTRHRGPAAGTPEPSGPDAGDDAAAPTLPLNMMPWRVLGEKWHLGPKGFPLGAAVQWDPAILPALIELLRQAAPDLEFTWTGQHAVTVRVAGANRVWATLYTKQPESLDLGLIGRPGQFGPDAIEALGFDRDLEAYPSGDQVHIRFRARADLRPRVLAPFLVQHLAGSRAFFGSRAATG